MHRHSRSVLSQGWWQRFLRRWFLANFLVAGVCALAWLLLRSGSKPSRFAYPCQQAALSAATLAFGAPLVGALLAARRTLAVVLRSPTGIVAAGLGLLVTWGVWSYLSRAEAYSGPQIAPPRDYRAQLYHVTNCPQAPVGERFIGLDSLITLMGSQGLKFYRSDTVSPEAGPDGIIAADDVVVVKINYQWSERGGTNTDLLRGLIRRILDHPDTFTGEVVVCENAQFNPVDNFDRASNNAQDHALSPHDVVVGFAAQGYTVSHFDWTAIRTTAVGEYSAGNMTNGYVVYPYDAQLGGRISYPKFQTSYGTRISLKYGIWGAASGTYDRARLKFINVPVLKSHHATYGVTACVKHYMGVVTGELSTNSHSAIGNGILGALMGEIQMADLNILDCIWINANPYSGPSTTYGGATRRDELVVGVDPVAIDLWAAKNILIPAFLANGYSPPWPSPSADPDNPASAFRIYLDRSMNYLLAAGYQVTNDPGRIDVFTWDGSGHNGDFNGDGLVTLGDYAYLAECLAGPGVTPAPPPPVTAADCLWAFDFDADADVDLYDFAGFLPRFGAGD
jgi:hypothetical protein